MNCNTNLRSKRQFGRKAGQAHRRELKGTMRVGHTGEASSPLRQGAV
jgi:hypothetical protein